MVTHTRLRSLRAAFTACATVGTALVLVFSSACDKVPLTAPTGSVITLFATASNVPLNGEIEIVATVIENGTTSTPSTGTGTGTGTTGTTGTTTSTTAGAGTPVQNGTLVSFTTTLGTITPSEARTNNGQVRVKFKSGQSGTATITAFSGGASGKLENLKIGTAAAERVLVTANPQTLGPSGGTAVITARVEDTAGSGLTGVPVTFTTDAGTLTTTSATTDQNGVATTTLNTAQKATVTANVAGKTATATVNLNSRTGVSIAAPTTPVSAGVAAAFTVGVSTAANIRDVIVDWGDGSDFHVGALTGSTTIPHTYETEGTYTVRATAIDATGFSEPAATQIRVLPGQPPSVTITAPQSASVNSQVTVSANVTGATSTVLRYEWTFGPDAVPSSVVTSSRSTTVRWTTTGTKTFSVRVIQAAGPEGDQVASITIVQ